MIRNLFSPDGLRLLLLSLPAVLWAISFHEFCHGYAAKLMGDPTAERQGRLTLNPLAHFDPVGAFLLLFCGFGWAKPVPINTRYFRNPRSGILLVSLAGPAGNLLTAIVCVLFLRGFGDMWVSMTGQVGFLVILRMISINMSLAAFNLIPIPPLDGSKVLYAFIPFRYVQHYYWLEWYGMFILLALVLTRVIDILYAPISSLLWSFLPFGNYNFLRYLF